MLFRSVAVAVETERSTATAQEAIQQAEIAASVFGGEEFGDRDLAGGVVDEGQQSKFRAPLFEPAMQAAIEQEHFAFAGTGSAALAMKAGATLAGRGDAGRAQKAAESFASDGKALELAQFFAEMVIVKASIGGAG